MYDTLVNLMPEWTRHEEINAVFMNIQQIFEIICERNNFDYKSPNVNIYICLIINVNVNRWTA